MICGQEQEERGHRSEEAVLPVGSKEAGILGRRCCAVLRCHDLSGKQGSQFRGGGCFRAIA